MSEEIRKNVFISHYGEDDEHVQNLKAKLAEKGYQIRNSSIDSTKPNEAKSEEYIKQLLREGISWAGAFICLVGPDTHTRPWVDWEIEQAEKMGKKIVGIFLHGAAQDSKLPKSLALYYDQLVGWNMDKIIDALASDKRYAENPDGSDRAPSFGIKRGEC